MAIQSFSCKETQELFQTGNSKRFANILRVATRRLTVLDNAVTVESMRAPPGNDLKFYGGAYRVRINGQWRLSFKWGDNGPYDVVIEDPH